MDTPYIPNYFMRGYAGGADPWSNLSHQYGQELSQDQTAYQQAVNQPNTLFDKFRQAYVDAQQRKMQQDALDRQQMLAESLQQHRMNLDNAAEARAQTADARQASLDEQSKLNGKAKLLNMIAGNSPDANRLLGESGLADKLGVGDLVPKTMSGNDLGGSKAPTVSLPSQIGLTAVGGRVGGADFSGLKAPMDPNDPTSINTDYQGGSDWQDAQTEAQRKAAADAAKEAKAAAQQEFNQKKLDQQHQEFLDSTRSFQNAMALQSAKQKGSGNGSDLQALWDAADPVSKLEAQKLAAQWDREGVPPAGIGRNKQILGLVYYAHGLLGQGQTQPTDLAGAKAGYKSDSKSLSDLVGMTDKVNAFEKTALGNWGAFEKAVTDAGNTVSPFINKPLNTLKVLGAGNENVAAAAAAGRIAINEISKVLNSANAQGVVSDSARHEIESILPGGPENASLSQVLAVGKILKGDMERRRQSYADQIAEVRKRVSSGNTGSGSSTPAPGTIQDGYRFKGGVASDPNNWEKVQ